MALCGHIKGRDGQIAHIPADGAPSSPITCFCGGDLSSVGVDLKQGDVLVVGDLADQAVAQMSVGSLWVVLIQRKDASKWDTLKNKENRC